MTTLKLTSLTLKTALDRELVRGWLGASLVSSGELESTKLELTGVLLNRIKKDIQHSKLSALFPQEFNYVQIKGGAK